MATEYPEKTPEVVFRLHSSAWSESRQGIVEYDLLHWNTGAVTWRESETKWWETEVLEETDVDG